MNRNFLVAGLAMVMMCAAMTNAQVTNPPGTRTLPARLNPAVVQLPPPPPSAATKITPAPIDPHAGHNHAPIAAPAGAVPPRPPVTAVPNTVLAWDAEMKEYTTKPGEVQGNFTFYFTNVSAQTIAINSAAASCGCTVPKLPALPWKIEPGTGGEIPVVMNVAGKIGSLFKTVTVNTDQGPKILTVKVNITPPGPAVTQAMNGPMDRSKNQELAKSDRTAIFKGDCASCHVEKSRGRLGKDLYASSCGICHDAEHRAHMVPDLRKLKHDTNADYWKTWISLGKPGTLMPGFAQSEGGPLNETEINSLVQYLVTTIPTQAARPASGN